MSPQLGLRENWRQLSLAVLGLLSSLAVGTALGYPTFLAAVAEYVPLAQRAHSMGCFRF